MSPRPAYLLQLGPTPYLEALELQRSLAGAVSQGAIPDTVVLLEHPPVVTTGRRTADDELHVPVGATVEVVETDRGGRSTYHAPGQLVCYPIFDLDRHGRDVRRYCRDLEEAVILTLAPFGVAGERIDGLTGVWVRDPHPESSHPTPAQPRPDRPATPRKIASIGVRIARWVTTHGYALNVDLDTAPFSKWITACGLDEASFTTLARELDRAVPMDDVRPCAVAALERVFDLALESLPADEGSGLWRQPVHGSLAARSR
jgi:lipoate-protein ligase B